MDTPEYDIIFRGDIVFGHQLNDVKQKLQVLFKADAAKIDALFTGRPVPLKRNLDESSANKYRDALTKAGAVVELVLSNGEVKSSSGDTHVAARSPIPSRAKWTLAPVGSLLLLASERPRAPKPLVIGETHLTLRAQQGNLLDASEAHQQVEATVTVPNLGLAELGANLVEASEKITSPVADITLENWDIAELGSDLLTPAERSVVVPAVTQVSDFGLAPVGSDLGQIKPKITPVVPDISGLSLHKSGS